MENDCIVLWLLCGEGRFSWLLCGEGRFSWLLCGEGRFSSLFCGEGRFLSLLCGEGRLAGARKPMAYIIPMFVTIIGSMVLEGQDSYTTESNCFKGILPISHAELSFFTVSLNLC